MRVYFHVDVQFTLVATHLGNVSVRFELNVTKQQAGTAVSNSVFNYLNIYQFSRLNRALLHSISRSVSHDRKLGTNWVTVIAGSENIKRTHRIGGVCPSLYTRALFHQLKSRAIKIGRKLKIISPLHSQLNSKKKCLIQLQHLLVSPENSRIFLFFFRMLKFMNSETNSKSESPAQCLTCQTLHSIWYVCIKL